nr:uncharacterized protein LOC125419733 [Ziziphus jujuba var. spinosa]
MTHSVKGSFRLTGIYGNPEPSLRHFSWKLLERLSLLSKMEWFHRRFNEILSPSDKQGSCPRAIHQIDMFREAVDSCFLQPILLLDTNLLDLMDVVSAPMKLKRWNKYNFNHIKIRLRQCYHSLSDLQTTTPTETNIRLLHNVEKEIDCLLDKEEARWRQRSRLSWLRDGDRNTKYFHKHATSRFRRNYIGGITDSEGHWISDQKASLNTCLRVLNDGDDMKDINHTLIALVPEVQEPLQVSDFRPISLWTVMYEIISKSIVNRLKSFLPEIISAEQSAFVPEHQISDNVLLAFEHMHVISKRKSGFEGLMAIKFDMSKAYDRVEWVFLQWVMQELGFDHKSINLVMRCVSEVYYSLLISGKQCDDTILFTKATPNECLHIMHILRVYEHASGQRINLQKTVITFSPNMSQSIRDFVTQSFQLQNTSGHQKYLGLPSLLGLRKQEAFEVLKHVWKRLDGWNSKLLSYAGKEVLIKAVAQAIPTYAMSCFKLPKRLVKDLTSLMNRFWWVLMVETGCSMAKLDATHTTKGYGRLGI